MRDNKCVIIKNDPPSWRNFVKSLGEKPNDALREATPYFPEQENQEFSLQERNAITHVHGLKDGMLLVRQDRGNGELAYLPVEDFVENPSALIESEGLRFQGLLINFLTSLGGKNRVVESSFRISKDDKTKTDTEIAGSGGAPGINGKAKVSVSGDKSDKINEKGKVVILIADRERGDEQVKTYLDLFKRLYPDVAPHLNLLLGHVTSYRFTWIMSQEVKQNLSVAVNLAAKYKLIKADAAVRFKREFDEMSKKEFTWLYRSGLSDDEFRNYDGMVGATE